MGEMVLNYSVNKKGLEAHADKLKVALAEFRRARQMMVELMLEDQSAYEALTTAKKMPPDSPQRAATVASAVLICARVPQTMAATAVAILELADTLVEIVNPYLLSDLAVCAELAMATTRAALYNVWVNLREISDQRDRRRFEEDGEKLRLHAVNAVQRLMPRIWARV